MFTYSQTSGHITDGTLEGSGYSGRGAGLNNSAMQAVHDIGPIPQGMWEIGDFFDDPGGKGPVVCDLTPCEGTETFGRTGLMCHGDNKEANHTASEGCLILPRAIREAIRDSGDKMLMVTA